MPYSSKNHHLARHVRHEIVANYTVCAEGRDGKIDEAPAERIPLSRPQHGIACYDDGQHGLSAPWKP